MLTQAAVEMHMVFQSAAEEIAVVGVYIDIDMSGVTSPPPVRRRAIQVMPHAAVNGSAPLA